MEIFNKQIFGQDAKDFFHFPKAKKVEWVKKYTGAHNDASIEEFLTNLKNPCDCDKPCMDCGKKKQDANISKTNAIEVTANIESKQTSGAGKKNSSAGQSSIKK